MSAPDPVSIFRTEASELLEQVESGLLDLANDLDNHDLVDAIFRGLHTLKGSGAMFGFDALAGFTHHCETAFDRVRKGDVPATSELVYAVLAARDHMRALIEGDDPSHEATGAALLADLHAAVSGGAAPQAPAAAPAEATVAAPKAAPAANAGFSVRMRLPANTMENGTNPLMLISELADLGDAKVRVDLSSVPALDALNPSDLHLGWHVDIVTDKPRSAIEDVFIFVMDEMELTIEELVAEAPVVEAAPEVAAPVAVSAPVAPVEAAPVPAVRKAEPAKAVEARPAEAQKTSESVRVPAERLDELMDRVGELVIAQSRLSQLANASMDVSLRSISEEIERLSSELRDTMMVMRMVPVAQLFSRFRRLVHDLSRETGKGIDLVTEGESTEVDKTVMERLADPLVHLVRNSVDHGIETPEQRLAAGKPEAGRVVLNASQSGGEVVITITDDGRGMDRDRIRQKAESQGIISPNAVLSDSEILQLIFQPGFSTAAAVTNLSGRGVGMDVVKRTIEALRGSIEVKSKMGEGSVVSLRIPLTLAIIDGLLVRVGQGRYVIPLSAVEECLELSLEDDLRSRGSSFITVRDSLIPFLRLRDLFDTQTRPDPHQKIVVVSTGNERVGLVVDQIIGDHQTVIKSLSKLHSEVATFSGATILGDGSVALILDVQHLVLSGQQQEARLRAAS